jgi:hypothetical protein
MRARASVIVLAVILVAGAYALVSRPGPTKREHESPSPGVTAVPPPVVDTPAAESLEAENSVQKAAGHVFRGTVVEAKTLRPVEGARAALLGSDPRAALAEGITKSDGSYALESGGAGRPSSVEVRMAGFLPQRWGIYREPEDAYDFELERGRTVKGTIRFRDGTAVASGQVFVLETRDIRSSDLPFPVARDGTFEAAAEGEDVVVLAIGYAFQPAVSEVIDLGSGEQVELAIEVERGRFVTGVVEDGEGRPIPDARVEASLSCPELDALDDFLKPDGFESVTLTDARGRFTLGGFGIEPVKIHVRASGFDDQAAAEEGGPFRITLAPEASEPTRTMTFGVSAFDEEAPLPPQAYLGAKSFHRKMKLEGARYTLAGFWTAAGKGWVQVPGFARVPVEWPEGTEDHDFGEIELERGRTIEISVVDGKGRGVPNATVLLDPDFGSCGTYDGLEDVPFETDVGGALLLGGLWDDDHGLWITKPGYISKHTWFVVADGNVSILLDEEAVLKGRALGARGEPAARASISFRLDERNTSRDTTDWTGAFLVRVPAGRELRGILIAAHASPTPFQVTGLAPGEHRDLGDLKALPGETLGGRAIDDDGKPLASRTISISPQDSYPEDDDLSRFLRELPDTQTDRDGRFEFRGLVPGKYELQLFLEGDVNQKRTVSVPSAGPYLFDLNDPELQMYSGIVRKADGSPAHGAFVTLSSRELRDDNFDDRGETDSEGRFKLHGIPQAFLQPVARARYRLLSATAAADTVPELPKELVLEPGCDLRIHVQPEGDVLPPESPYSLELTRIGGRHLGTLRSKPDGVFQSNNFPAGSFRGTITAPDYLPAEIDIETRLDQPFTGSVVLRKLPPARTCTILVTDAEGLPLEGVWTTAAPLFRTFFPGVYHTQEDGRIELSLIPHEENIITLRRTGYYPAELRSLEIRDREEWKVVLYRNGEIQARVSIPGDAAGVDYLLEFEPLDVPRWQDYWENGTPIITEPDEYERNLPAGRYALLVLSRGSGEPWIVARVEATVIDGRTTEVDLELPAHFRIQGRVASAGRPLAGKPYVLSMSRDGREYRLRGNLDETGRFSRSACVPGSYTISVGDGGLLRRVSTVEIAGDVDLDLALEHP